MSSSSSSANTSLDLAPLYRRRGDFTAFVWTEAMGECGPVKRHWSGGSDANGWLGVGAGYDAQKVWDSYVIVTDDNGESRAMTREDFEAEYVPL